MSSLILIAHRLYRNSNGIRSLNIAYNQLSGSHLQIEVFLEHFKKYLERSKVLNHLNISGMNFKKEDLSDLKEGISKLPHLLSLHLSFTDDHVVPQITLPHADTI